MKRWPGILNLKSPCCGKIRRFEIAGGGRADDSVAQSVSDGFKSMIHEFTQKVESYDGDMSARVQTNRVVEIKQLRLKMEAYQDVLLGYANDVRETLEKANATLLAKINGTDVGAEVVVPPAKPGCGSGTAPSGGNGQGTQDKRMDAASAETSKDERKEAADRSPASVSRSSVGGGSTLSQLMQIAGM